jgi:DNA-nicking Smr family endonuclease
MTSNPRSRKRPLTAEEADLWLLAMRQTKALRRRDRERLRQAADADEALSDADAKPVQPAQGLLEPSSTAKPTRTKQQSPPTLAPFDERQRRKLGKDTDLIEARLDLHGMRQTEAHSALKSFLRSCAANGMRHVLVITGKGRSRDDSTTRDFFREERGVLRRLVPEWLTDPEIRGVVLSYTASHIRHGGDGALYIRLRKASRK